MTRAEWTIIARALGGIRIALESNWPPKGGYVSNAADAHDRKLIYFAQLEIIDRVSIILAATIDKLGGNFDLGRWMRLIRGGR